MMKDGHLEMHEAEKRLVQDHGSEADLIAHALLSLGDNGSELLDYIMNLIYCEAQSDRKAITDLKNQIKKMIDEEIARHEN